MARKPPNQPSKHRMSSKEKRNCAQTGRTVATGNFYSTSGQRGVMEGVPSASTERLTSTPEQDRGREPRLNGSTSSPSCSPIPPIPSTSSSNSSTPGVSRSHSQLAPNPEPDAAVIPSVPGDGRRNRCLDALNLPSAALNQEDATVTTDFMAKLEAFFERQKGFNERMEQRVSESLAKERESGTPRTSSKRLPKALSVSHLS